MMLDHVRNIVVSWIRRLLATVLWYIRTWGGRKPAHAFRPSSRHFTPPWETRAYFTAEDTEGLVVSHATPTAVRTARIELPDLFRNPHNKTKPLQIAVARNLLSFVGATYLPGRLIAQLESRDAFSAVRLYLSALGFFYQELLGDDGLREFFSYCTSLLAEVDFLRRRAKLSDEPLYRAIRARDGERLVALAERLRKISHIVLSVDTDAVRFGPFLSDLKRPLEDSLRRWDSLGDPALDELEDALNTWTTLQREYDSVAEACRNIVAVLNAFATSSYDKELLEALPGVVSALSSIDADAVATGEPAELIDRLRDVYDDLLTIAKSRGISDSGFASEAASSATSDARIRELLERLELGFPDGLDLVTIEAAFRRLARRYHPDVGGSDAAFQAISEARNELFSYIKGPIR